MRSRCALQGAHNPRALGVRRVRKAFCAVREVRRGCRAPRLPAHAACPRTAQGYLKKVRPGETTRYTGYLCRRDIHEFLFAETPVDEAAPPSSSAEAAQRLGCVAVTIFATRRVRVDDSSSDDEQGHSSSGAITATHLPEKQAVKEYGVQARA